jgi:hypothetical protein
VLARERVKRPLEGGVRDAPGRELVEDLEAGIKAGRKRMAAQDSRAEPVDRPDPRPFGLSRLLPAPELREAAAQALAQLAGSFLGERSAPGSRRP